MITSWDIYWITRLDSIQMLCSGLFALCVVAVFLACMIGNVMEENFVHYKKSIITSALLSFLCLVFLFFIPTTKEFAAIYLIPKIANNEQMQKIPDNAAKLLNVKMEEWINDTLSKKDGD